MQENARIWGRGKKYNRQGIELKAKAVRRIFSAAQVALATKTMKNQFQSSIYVTQILFITFFLMEIKTHIVLSADLQQSLGAIKSLRPIVAAAAANSLINATSTLDL